MPDPTPPLAALLAARIANPGHYLPRHTDSTGPYEAISRWSARAIAAGLEDGSLGYVPAAAQLHRADFDRLAAERDRWKNNFGTSQAEADRLAVELATERREHGITDTALRQAIAERDLARGAERIMTQQRDRLTDRIDAIRALHTDSPAGFCPSCFRANDVSDTDDGLVAWPCPTLQAMEPVPGSSRRAPEAEPTGAHAWSETAGLSFVVTACTRCGIVQRRDGASGPCHGPDRVELRAQEPEPTDDELAAEIDSAEEAADGGAEAHAQGYAEAVARLRDDERYRGWWTSGGVKPDAPIRRHLADYLETVGPDGVDVTTGRWPAREHAVHDALVAAKPGDVFAFDQQPGQRVLIVVAAADCAPDSTTGGCCPSCGSRYPRRIPAGEDQRCWTCWLADPGAGAVGEDQLLERLEALPVEPAVAAEDVT